MSDTERTILAWLIAQSPGAQGFEEQLVRLRVVSRCNCGCPTVDLALDTSPKEPMGPTLVIASGEAMSPEGVPVGIQVHVRNGVVSELELYSMSGAFPISWPDIATIQLYG